MGALARGLQIGHDGITSTLTTKTKEKTPHRAQRECAKVRIPTATTLKPD
jgi:hypothetical protein